MGSHVHPNVLRLGESRLAKRRCELETEAHAAICSAYELLGSTELAVELGCSISNVERMVSGTRGGAHGLRYWVVRRCEEIVARGRRAA